MKKTLIDYIEEGVSTDLMQAAQLEIGNLFMTAIPVGYYETETSDDDEWDSRLILFIGDTDFETIQKTLEGINYQYITTEDEDGNVFTGFVRGYVDIIFERSSVIADGRVIQGWDLGIYAERDDVNSLFADISVDEPLFED